MFDSTMYFAFNQPHHISHNMKNASVSAMRFYAALEQHPSRIPRTRYTSTVPPMYKVRVPLS